MKVAPLALLLLLALSPAAGQASGQTSGQAFKDVFRNLTASESGTLEYGEQVMRLVPGANRLGLSLSGQAADEIRARVAAARPNYISELLLAVPVKDDAAASDFLGRLYAALADVEGYKKIPYWSKRRKMTFDLFDRMQVLDRRPSTNGESVDVFQHMEPFNDFKARYSWRREKDSVRFSGVNLEPIVYTFQPVSAVQTGSMLWELLAVRRGDRLFVYGVGAVRAFDMLGLVRESLETSFMGRVDAFFSHIAKKIGARGAE